MNDTDKYYVVKKVGEEVLYWTNDVKDDEIVIRQIPERCFIKLMEQGHIYLHELYDSSDLYF